MRTRILSLILVVIMLLGVLAGCGKNDVLTTEQAQKIAIETAGLSSDEVTNVHTHIVTEDGIPCYSVHITAGDKEFSCLISAADGEVLSTGNETGH